MLAQRGTDRKEREPQFLAIAQAEKAAVEWVSMGVIGIGDAAEYSRFSLGDPSL
jgi:hypothetical protein